ncbi:hypothetical protein Goari_025159 [Gossypium aridum]|uniref:RNase H type-1 domain-containing protein n=1 Tax=Gossypium aridum TaxID=34290 RepID=A0A7J8X991_GOSAI|nr:hypothetical protein [Gossypium aridum]
MDAAVSTGCSGFGAVARDHDGVVLGGCYKFVVKSLDVIWAELEALNEGLKLVGRLKVAQLILESDSAMLVNKVKKRMQDVTILGQRIKQDCKAFNKCDGTTIHDGSSGDSGNNDDISVVGGWSCVS